MNTERKFWLLARPSEKDGAFVVTPAFILPSEGMVRSALLDGEGLFHTIESSFDVRAPWHQRSYDIGNNIDLISDEEVPAFTYGLAINEDGIWTIADSRAKAGGLFRNKKREKQIRGNGVCFLPNGDILTTRYRKEDGPVGKPGELAWVQMP